MRLVVRQYCKSQHSFEEKERLIDLEDARLIPGSSAIFVLVRKATPDKVIDESKPFGGTILRSSLPKTAEANLQAALSGVA